MRLLIIACLIVVPALVRAQHPIAFSTKEDLAFVSKDIQKYPLLQRSFTEIKNEVDAWIDKDVDVPLPKDPAGGYTHERHKANYMLMFNSGLLYNLTHDARYAKLIKNMLLKYTALNPTLKKHPHATSSSPGRIFWQALNDANWLVYTGMAYDFIRGALTPAERKSIEDGAFRPQVEYLTKDLETWFNLIHNHGVWACAGVGIAGIATGNKEYVQMALYGTKKDGKSGFLAQMDQLFSPDGYYTEGPYYVRYALLPYYIFANALHHARPELKIFEYRNQILRKALLAGLQQTNIDGTFFPFNDAIKDKDFTTSEMVSAIGIARAVYGSDPGFLTIANRQGRVLLHKGGASIAAEMTSLKSVKDYYPYKTVEYADGATGKEGGVSFLRMGNGANLTTLMFKYPAHGLSHGHYDKLGLFLYDKGNEVLQDYGSVRFVNVEQKYGGRYLPENDAFAAQTIAHSTLVADEESHFDAKEKVAEKYHSEKLFSQTANPGVLVVSAKDVHAYRDIQMQRTLYMLQLPESAGNIRIIVDLFNASSANHHQYDLPFQYKGQVIKTSFPYKPFTSSLETFGNKNGYQYYWKEAEATANGPMAQFTFLNGKTYYTISSLTEDSTRMFFVRSGANDPNFNLRREPAYVIRKKGSNTAFVNVIEIHGTYDPRLEVSVSSYSSVNRIELLQNDNKYTVASIGVGDNQLLIAQSNDRFGTDVQHSFHKEGVSVQWSGPCAVIYNGKPLQLQLTNGKLKENFITK